ncbi:MAG: Gfo/Idh/MocA family oxidoreductase [Actinomycetota bacterium]|jgi:scyllo-inositol 2-dehydrogenase (NADP+)|nr:Gfo/Idh/MocA family oxidoreductase [Actinomycetota bacterium]MDA2998100.1 Gfo/Idh/MocA family oxidoreductase [Actinomycetota bacterium]MDA3036018.1 Gfo/Idh/MocA family oxidoreductase [Actinomycetota bacterium]
MAPRVGIAGYGLAGRYFHAPFLKAADFEVVGALTTKPDRKAAAILDFPEISVVESIEELLKLNLDLLVVASANKAHASQAIAGLKAGVPVVVDKPMGRTLKETKEIVDFSKQVNVPVTTYFNRKWDSDALTIKKIIKEGVLGNIFRLDSRFERYRPDLSPESWRENQTAIEGGGNLLDLQPHLVSTALDWFGPANLISASVRSLRGGSDDDVTLVLEHTSGVDSYLSVSSINAAPGPRIRITGDKGSLVINEIDPQEPLLKSGKYPKNGQWSESTKSEAFLHLGDKVISYPSIDGNYSLFYIQVKQALSGGVWPVTTDEALSVAEIIDKAREISFR